MGIVPSCAAVLASAAGRTCCGARAMAAVGAVLAAGAGGEVDCGVTLATMLAEMGGCELVAMLLSGVCNVNSQPSADDALP